MGISYHSGCQKLSKKLPLVIYVAEVIVNVHCADFGELFRLITKYSVNEFLFKQRSYVLVCIDIPNNG